LQWQGHVGTTSAARGKGGKCADKGLGRGLDCLIVQWNRKLARERRMDAWRQRMSNRLSEYRIQAGATLCGGLAGGFVFDDLHAGLRIERWIRQLSVCAQPARGINGVVAEDRVGTGALHRRQRFEDDGTLIHPAVL